MNPRNLCISFTSVQFFISDFSLLSCELDNFTVKCYTESLYIEIIEIILKQNKFAILSQSLVKDLK